LPGIGVDAVSGPLAELLGVSEAPLDQVDPVGLSRSLGRALLRSLRHPFRTGRAVGRYAIGGLAATAATLDRAVGRPAEGPVSPAAKDRRFVDRAWSENAGFFALEQLYLLNRRLLEDLVEAASLPEPKASKARFAASLFADALAPTNALLTNPTALQRAFETGGLSVARGARNFVTDLRTNDGWPRQVDTAPFELGRNMAASDGQVVFRNELVELIQYAPMGPEVHAIPLICCPPWINKYYIMDLAPGKSLVEWARRHDLTTFAISYRNPDESMRHLTFDDYLLQGPCAAIDAVRSITGVEKVNTLSICLGGTLHAAMLAYLDANGDDLVNTSTYLNSLVDFSEAGTLGTVFTDEQTVETLTRRMEGKGYLEAKDMARTFDLLRANELVFNYVATNWLMGETPPAFDLLAWNNDSTRMPARMHSFYLRQCYGRNALARDQMVLAGVPLKLTDLRADSYVVAAVDDHIVPWRASYKTTQIFKGDARFVLSSAGHIAGIVNPPGPKTRLWTNGELPPDPDQWLAGATEHQDTWWNDWARWIVDRSGPLGPAPSMGDARHVPLGPAPGSYVHG
jgi:polyhydroxyalkanoate synthase subunit PhaC